jgi:hypothetical protein
VGRSILSSAETTLQRSRSAYRRVESQQQGRTLRYGPPAYSGCYIIGIFAVLLCACGSAGARAGYTSQQQTIDGMMITLERPQQITILQNVEYFVTLVDASGKRVDGAKVYLEQDMPAMKMSSNQPLGEGLGNGQYRLKSVFTMDGAWVVAIHASIAGKDYAASFDQPVVPQP